MSGLAGSIRADVLKLRQRWMPYVLLLVMLAGAALMIWGIGYSSYYDAVNEDRDSSFRTFAFPYSIPALLDAGQFWGAALFVSILTTSMLATEHSWGTVRTAVTGGQSRAQYLLSKLLVLTVVSTSALLIALGFGLLLSLWATDAAGFNIPVQYPGELSVWDVALMIGRAALSIVPYGLLAFALTVLSRSTALGIAGTLGFMVLEAIVVGILGTSSGLLEDSRALFIGHNVSALMAENRIGGLGYDSPSFRDLDAASLPGVWTATAVLIAESAVLLGVSFLVFLRRDISVSHE